ncbi:MAG TPA: adenylate/guanylate cyclase domain-containing protein [Gaiellaceae bacterium]|nr:adenylate/guanylate cyclase domain-containing protein [Gaiellaceae bacterium]
MTSVEASATCPSCGRANAADAHFCSNCGAQLDGAGRPAEERKLVSILFVDLVGSTARSDGADPEDVRDALHVYHAEAKRRIEDHGGTLEKFIGDAVMAVFGAPTSHGDDAERAVRAALSVVDGVADVNRTHDLELAVRVAVNTGEAIVTLGAQRGEALAIGDVVNTAARLQSAAPTGRVIVGAETHRATRQSIRFEALPAIDAKGKAEPVEAWLVIEAVTEPSQRPLAQRELVGRSHEVELLRTIWTRAATERRPHLVTVVGPPGIGKSTLCRATAAFVERDGGRILRGRCLPYGEQSGYQAFSFLVRDASGIIASDPLPVAREKLARAVAEVMPEQETAEVARNLSFLLGLAPEGDMDARSPALLFYAARRFLECLGLECPTLLVFEDVHWAQPSELELLQHLSMHLRDSPLVLIAMTRPELLDSNPAFTSGLVPQATIVLDPLSPEHSAELAAAVIGEVTDRNVDLERVVEVAGGNPLFLEELAASVAELGEGATLPVTVREAIAARIDALPADARSALMSAAVVGRAFWRGVLSSVGDVGDIDAALAVLELRDLIRREPASQLSGDAQFTFKHMLIRDVAYATVPRAARRTLHAEVARSIEDAVGESAETLHSILAYHWSEGGEPARAIPYLLSAAEVARRAWARGAVIDLYSKALELAGDDDLRTEIRLRRGLALVAIQDYERAADDLADLLPELEGQQRLDALIGRARATLWTERDVETLAIAHEALPLAEALHDETAIPAALAIESQGLAMRGAEGDLDRALELGDRALELWVPGARRYDLADHFHLHADVLYWTGNYERTIEMGHSSRALASDVRSAEALLRGGGLEALGLAGLGRHEEAIAIWSDLVELARQIGRSPAVVLNYSALAFRELYDVAEARRRSEEALELSLANTFGMPTQFARSDLLYTQLLEGDVGGAQVMWPRLWEGAEDATAWTTWLIAGRLANARAEIAVAAESPESAIEWAEHAIAVARRTHRRKYEARSLTALGQAHARLGRRDEALAALRAAVAIAEELVGAPARWRATDALGRAAYELGDDEQAASAYAETRRLIEAFAAGLRPERASAFMASEPVRGMLSTAGS